MYDFCPNCGADMRGGMENNYTKETKKSESENPVEVCLSSSSMNVVFNNVGIRIKEFIFVLDRYSCKYEQAENVFEITANSDTLYRILLYLTIVFEEIALY